ncbi:MAG: hypothetical protein N0C88_11685 [Candidatus Thiodiazotropha lotti]|uniref:KAP NTPase domain-containing protein n=1 Tax=Candidatus Thiodiazotropha lotti TaxID=2792787 RepID=A0A9E4K4X6_9GAMM|nr:hypothetical protein [Candidatus Thiodiazotropha lotti]MCW4203963.1 hypothetical protein [Candidatus Thiodiazotropha lotti]
MSQIKTKEAILDALGAINTPVIALTGDWGSGKTHLWKEDIAKEVTKLKTHTPIYISSIGISSINELKTLCATRLLSLLSSKNISQKIYTYINKHLDKASKLIPSKIQSNIADAFIFLPEIKKHLDKNILIVIDDIERTDNINVTQLHGFISILIEELNFRVLLILNSEKLDTDNKEKWERIYEKLVSREVKLTTTASEAVDIGLNDITGNRYKLLHKYIDKLNITNIRIIQHIKRVCDAILSSHNISDEAYESLAKSIILFTTIHLKGIEDWPPIDWIVKQSKHPTLDNDNESISWKYKIDEYNLGFLDDFEYEILVPFLRTGHLNKILLDDYIQQTELRIEKDKHDALLSKLYTKEYWDPNRTSEQILNIINDLLKKIELTRQTEITALAKIANNHEANGYEKVINAWLDASSPIIKKATGKEHDFDNIIKQSDIDKRIRDLYSNRKNELYPSPTLTEALEYIDSHNSYGTRYEQPIINSTEQDYIELLKTADGNLTKIIARYFTQHLGVNTIDHRTRERSDNFRKALQSIMTKQPDTQLAKIWRRVLEENNIDLDRR